MKNTRKKKNNNKKKTKKCIKTFVKKKMEYWTNFMDEQISTDEKKILNKLKKLYQLDNCNINCKNTLLEPGSPNQLPKSMRKKYYNNKALIKSFTKKRKHIFKNKRNVLIDNFYENIPEVKKQNLIKEGAISECIPLLKIKHKPFSSSKDSKQKHATM